jgi:ABC-type multidrug transport system ATPase subunit
MSERILEALLQMFAVVASVRDTGDMNERRMVVYNFLINQLNQELANKYISIFDESYRTCIAQVRRSDNQYKVISRVSSKVTRIAVEMNRELSQYQKYIVLVQLYEYLNTGHISYVEQGLVSDVVADKFNIRNDEFKLIRDFILNTNIVAERVIFSSDDSIDENSEPKQVLWEDLGGELHFVYLTDVNLFLVKYISETNELEMNGTQIISGRTYIMRAGNSLRNGICSPIFFNDMMRHIASLNTHTPITLEARNVEYWFSKDTIGLNKFSFEAHSGRLVGIMGVSGSGKSTFSNVISGMAQPQKGKVYLNNIDIYENPEAIKGLIGYVSQDDILIEDLTVYDNLYYNARMSFNNLPLQKIRDRIDSILNTLGLYDIKDIKVGSPMNKKISGGQRKRLNIALELIREPAILILDEPTSGLSSHDSENIIELLKDLTIKGKLIFVVIHQPSSDIFKMFDQLLILDTGGYLIYDGNPIESLRYFRSNLHMLNSKDVECKRCGNINVEQVLTLISLPIVDEYGNNTQTRKVSPKEWYDKFNWGALDISYVGDPEPLPPITFEIPNKIKQLWLYLHRDLKAKAANLQYLIINFLEAPILGLVVALLLRYYNKAGHIETYSFYDNPNITVFLIMAVIIAFFIGLTVSAEEIIHDRLIIKREKFLNLSRSGYIMSKCLLTLGLSAIQMLMFVLVANSILGIRGMWFEYWLVLFSTAVSANLIGLIMSDTMAKTVNIYISIPFMVIPQLILSGVFVKFDKMNPDFSSVTSVPAYGQIITSRWAFEALAVNQFIYNEYETQFYQYHKTKSQAAYYKDYWVPTLKNVMGKALKATEKNDRALAQDRLNLVRNELKIPQHQFGDLKMPKDELFTAGLFGQAAYNSIMEYIENIRKFNVQRYNKADKAEDQYIKQLSPSELQTLKMNYMNKGLEEFVSSKGSLSEMISEYDGKLWQKTDLIYQDTDEFLSAPLFSPYKNVAGYKIDTYLFDIIVIWVQNTILFLALIGAWFNKLARWIRIPKLRK